MATDDRPRRAWMRIEALLSPALALALTLSGCATTAPEREPLDLGTAKIRLTRPLPGDPAALYRLRVPSSGGLRLALLTSGEAGRMTVSEPFGSAVSVTAWSGDGAPEFFDLREGCRLVTSDLSAALGVGAMPLPQAVRLLGGRMPAVSGDSIASVGDRLVIEGRGWIAEVWVEPDPWRIVSVRDADGSASGWRLDLEDHTGSVPGRIRMSREGRWAELELVRLEWNQGAELPPTPELPLCFEEGRP